MMRTTICYSMLLFLAAGVGSAWADVQFTDVFVGGAEGPGGKPHYRIPSLIVAPNGDLIAFAEGRPVQNDPGEVGGVLQNVVYKRSTDGGATWSPFSVLADGQYNYSDPRAVFDLVNGKLMVHYTQWPDGVGSGAVPAGQGPESSVAYFRTSDDNGLTWNDPVNINQQAKSSSWMQLDTGPGLGIQLQWQTNPDRNGRIVIPAWVREVGAGSTVFRNVSLYSDDHGTNWQRSPVISSVEANENQVVELNDGTLMLDARQRGASNFRVRSISTDGGATWGPTYSGDIPVVKVNTGLARYSATRSGDDRNRILYSGPLGATPGQSQGTLADFVNLGVWTSYDEGKSFINPIQIASGYASYSTLQKLVDGSIGSLYEAAETTLLRFANFSLSDLETMNVSPQLTHYDGFGNNIDRLRGGIGWTSAWTGSGVATNAESPALGGTGLSYAGGVFPVQSGRIDLSSGHNLATRQLATPIDLNTNTTTYVAFLVSAALDTSSNTSSEEYLSLELRDSSNVNRVRFGINSNEAFFVDTLGQIQLTEANALSRQNTYLLVAKIEAHDNNAPGKFDQISLKVFQSGVDPLPSNEDSMPWTVVGTNSSNSSALLDRIAFVSGSSATWSVDEVRIGTDFGAVIHNTLTRPGDFNLDGTVDTADYVVWRMHQNSAISLPNETATAGQVTQEDYEVWRLNFGRESNPAQSANVASVVPEPGAMEMLLLPWIIAQLRLRFQVPELVAGPKRI
ncbi:MAG: sialidase family protein [Pirellulales bacterium]